MPAPYSTLLYSDCNRHTDRPCVSRRYGMRGLWRMGSRKVAQSGQLHHYCRVLWSLSDCLRGEGPSRERCLYNRSTEGACVLQNSPAVSLQSDLQASDRHNIYSSLILRPRQAFQYWQYRIWVTILPIKHRMGSSSSIAQTATFLFSYLLLTSQSHEITVVVRY